MKHLAIGSLVGGLILFIWQFLAWGGPLGLHYSKMAYNPQQDAILAALDTIGVEPGSYFLPTVAKGTSMEDAAKMMEEKGGQPWALLEYHPSLENNMIPNMIRGLVLDILLVFVLSWVLMKIPGLDMQTVLLTSLAIGFIGYGSITYLNSIWFEANTWPDVLDTVVSWGLTGAWLGFWLPRATKA